MEKWVTSGSRPPTEPSSPNSWLPTPMDALLQDQLDLAKLLPALWNYFGGQLNKSQLEDGIRYTRGSLSYVKLLNSLKITVLKECENWLSSDGGPGLWKVSEGTFHVKFNDVVSEWIFIPLEDAQDQAQVAIDAANRSMAVGVHRDESGRCRAYIRTTRPLPRRTTGGTYLAWNDSGYQHANRTDTLAQIYGRLTVQLAEVYSTFRTFTERRELELASCKQRKRSNCRSIIRGAWSKEERTMTTSSKCTAKTILGSTDTSKPNMAMIRPVWRYSKPVFGRIFTSFKTRNLYPAIPSLSVKISVATRGRLICQPDHMGRLLVHEEVASNEHRSRETCTPKPQAPAPLQSVHPV